jgi:hypothetical protein
MQNFIDISQALLHGFVGIGVLGLLLKVARWDASAKWFDGTSMGEFTHPDASLARGLTVKSQRPTSLLSPLM